MIFYLIISMALTALGMKWFIILLKNTDILKRKETVDIIKKPCIKELHKSKLNTFTAGGLVMNIVFFIMTIVYYLLTNNFLWINIFIIIFGIMGFIDDYIKIKKIRDGVSVAEKLIGLTIISILVIFTLSITNSIDSNIIFPFINKSYEMNKIIYSIFMIILLVMSTNSVNITDGLDGLALGISIMVFSFIIIVSYKINNSEVLYTGLMLLGICLGALIYNKHPAKIFIGDTGSLFLGGAIAILLIKLNLSLWIIIVLIVCFWESLTVVIQLTSLKLRKKRVFKIAPYHHHLEKSGWKETNIVYLFWLITGIFCILGYIGLYIN